MFSRTEYDFHREGTDDSGVDRKLMRFEHIRLCNNIIYAMCISIGR